MLDYLADAAREAPAGPALWFKGRTVTWGELHAAAHAAACAFTAMGIRRGDRIALVLPNCPQFLVAEFGAWMMGAVICPVVPAFYNRPKTLDDIVNHSVGRMLDRGEPLRARRLGRRHHLARKVGRKCAAFRRRTRRQRLRCDLLDRHLRGGHQPRYSRSRESRSRRNIE